MKFFLCVILLSFISCSSAIDVKDRIRGEWYFSNDRYIRITKNEFITEHDSPIPDDYKFINDSIIVKGFEASIFPNRYLDTLQIVKLTSDSLILKSSDSLLIFFKR